MNRYPWGAFSRLIWQGRLLGGAPSDGRPINQAAPGSWMRQAYNPGAMPILDQRALEFVSHAPEQTVRLGVRLGERLQPGDVIGLELRARGRRIVWIANCGRLDLAVLERCEGCDVLFVDGTLWSDDELVRQGIAARTGREMGHVSIAGPEGVLARLGPVSARRKILVHVNNSNPVLLADSPERAEVERAGFEVAFDGMRIDLEEGVP